ncbi:VPS10 Vacuolar protein sorting/targeting protein 10 [Candida maltosa Xu316]
MKKKNFTLLTLFTFLLSLTEIVSAAYTPDISYVKNRTPAREIKYFDDSSTLLVLRERQIFISQDDGKSFNQVTDFKEPVLFFEMDPFNNQRAFVLTKSKTQYFTEDQGKSWKSFEIDTFSNEVASIPKITFNAANPNYLMVSEFECPDGSARLHRLCKHKYFYTTDGFKSNPKNLPIEAHVCRFSQSNKDSKIGKSETIYCSTNKLNSYGHVLESHLFKSDDWFKTSSEINPLGSTTGDIIDIKVEEDFMMAVSRSDKFNEDSKISAFISRDGENFNRADLEIDIKYGVMSFLPSSVSSLFLTIMDYNSKSFQTATFYGSDSSGLHFTPLLHEVAGGHIQKVDNIDGAWIANVGVDADNKYDGDKSLLDNLFGGSYAKDIVTKVSMNDGKDWSLLKLNDKSCSISDGCSLHLWEFGELNGEGKFVTGPTPGILLGVGNKGKHLANDFTKMKTFVSRDGGITWDYALDVPCVFSFGDQGNVIIAVPYNGKNQFDPAAHLYYSFDQGKTWEKIKLEVPIYPMGILTTIDGTSRKFIVAGVDPTEASDAEYIYSVDFTSAFDNKVCNDEDFEEFIARQAADNEPLCIYGHVEKFKRRKQDAQCFVNKLFEDVKVIEDPCQCTEFDFECAPGFKLSQKGGHTCVVDEKQITKMCADKKELNIPDKVLVQGNICDMKNKKPEDFIVEQTIDCSEYTDGDDEHQGDSNQIVVNVNEFEGRLAQFQYIADSQEKPNADNVVVKTNDDRVWISNNGGVSFVKVPIHDSIIGFYSGYVPGQVILITDVEIIYVSDDGGATFKKQRVPTKVSPDVIKAIAFHNSDPKKFIWFGEVCNGGRCTINAYVTDDAGDSFSPLLENVRTCDFVGAILEPANDNLIYCSRPIADRKLELVSLATPRDDPVKIFDNIVGYAMTGNYIVVATIDDKTNSLVSRVTIDGKIFADADFPHDLQVEPHQAFTVLDSSSKAIFMHITTNDKPGFEYGSLLKSNSNGTYFVVALENVNRNTVGYVDFDKIDGLEGTMIANVVANAKDGNGDKKLQTLMSHNDGSEWEYLVPPPVDSENNKYQCTGKPLEKCALHLHGFTERADYRDTYSSGSATGFLIGVGNVGEYLTDKQSASTFLSTDGGVTWKEIRKGVYMWEYGDQGTILVLVDEINETDSLLYSLDEGRTWKEFRFTDSTKIKAKDLATVPTDTARKFIIFAEDPKDRSNTLAFSIDFTNIHERQCQLNLDDPEHDDYEYWTPVHPLSAGSDKCLFGHESKYLRRAIGHFDCFIGSAPLDIGYKVVKNCSCTRRDYECDYNYYRDRADNTCKLVKGLTPADSSKTMCSKENAFQYFESTGYRKIPLSTCVGGHRFDNWNPKACPGKQKEFDAYYGREVKGHKLFFLIFIPLIIFLGSAIFVYDRGIRRNGGFKRLGQIRLNDEDNDGFDPIENDQVDVVVNKIVKGGIYTVAVVIATVKTIRKIDRALLERLGSLIFRRSPGRRNYVSVPADFENEEDELFGDYQDNIDDELEDARISSDDFTRHEAYVDEEEAVDEPTEVNPDERLFDIDDDDEEEGHPK